jgi:hypothetical protein
LTLTTVTSAGIDVVRIVGGAEAQLEAEVEAQAAAAATE